MDLTSTTTRKAVTVRLPSHTEIADWLSCEWRREVERRSLFHILPVGIGIGAVLVFGAGFGLHWALLVALIGLSASLNLHGRSLGRSGALSLLCLSIMLGVALGQIELWRTATTIFSGDGGSSAHKFSRRFRNPVRKTVFAPPQHISSTTPTDE